MRLEVEREEVQIDHSFPIRIQFQPYLSASTFKYEHPLPTYKIQYTISFRMNYLLLLGLLATGATTTPLLTTCASAKTCKTYDSIRLEVTSTNQIFSLPKFANNYYLTDFV